MAVLCCFVFFCNEKGKACYLNSTQVFFKTFTTCCGSVFPRTQPSLKTQQVHTCSFQYADFKFDADCT